MDTNIQGIHVGKYGALPCLTQTVRILLVDHDTNSLISVTSLFQQQQYKVTACKSANMALSLFRKEDSSYDIVIADSGMPDMSIFEFVDKIHAHRFTVPVILLATNLAKEVLMKTLGNKVCYVLAKPPSQSEIASLWMHIPRVTGTMPTCLDMSYDFELEMDGNPSSDIGRGGFSKNQEGTNLITDSFDIEDGHPSIDIGKEGSARNQKGKDLKMKSIVTEEGHLKRKKYKITETSYISTDSEEEDGHYSKKTNIPWNSHVQDKFLNATNILGKYDARPENILTLMNERSLGYRQGAGYFQIYEEHKGLLSSVQKPDSPVMPIVLPSTPHINFTQENTSATASSNYTASSKFLHCAFDGVNQAQDTYTAASKFLHCAFDGVNQAQNTFNYPGNNSATALINQYGEQVPENNGGIQEPYGADGLLSNSWDALNPEVGGASTDFQSNGWQESNPEYAGAGSEVLQGGNSHSNNVYQELGGANIDHPSNDWQVTNQKSASASGNVIQIHGQVNNGYQELGGASIDYLSNGWQVPNHESEDVSSNMIPVHGQLNNGYQELGGASIDYLSNGWQFLNQESAN